MAGLKFEKALERLEETVRALESPDLPIEESLRLFEEGVRLSRLCTKMLDEADRKIARLTEARPENTEVREEDDPDPPEETTT